MENFFDRLKEQQSNPSNANIAGEQNNLSKNNRATPRAVSLNSKKNEKQISNYEILSELGQGNYGIVYKVKSLLDGQIYAMKKINLAMFQQEQQKAALKEVQILKKIDCPYIIKYYNCFTEDNSLHIILEYAKNGDLNQVSIQISYLSNAKYQYLQGRNEKNHLLGEQEIWNYIYMLTQAINYLHNNKIIHRDIKSLNCLRQNIMKNCCDNPEKFFFFKLGDMGLSQIIDSQESLNKSRVGTPMFLAPEIIKKQLYDYKIDIWSLGCVVYNIATLNPPFDGDNLISLGKNIVHQNPKEIPMIYSTQLKKFVKNLLNKVPAKRPSAEDILRDLFENQPFQESRWFFLENAINHKNINKYQHNNLQNLNTQQINITNTNGQQTMEKISPIKNIKTYFQDPQITKQLIDNQSKTLRNFFIQKPHQNIENEARIQAKQQLNSTNQLIQIQKNINNNNNNNNQIDNTFQDIQNNKVHIRVSDKQSVPLNSNNNYIYKVLQINQIKTKIGNPQQNNFISIPSLIQNSENYLKNKMLIIDNFDEFKNSMVINNKMENSKTQINQSTVIVQRPLTSTSNKLRATSEAKDQTQLENLENNNLLETQYFTPNKKKHSQNQVQFQTDRINRKQNFFTIDTHENHSICNISNNEIRPQSAALNVRINTNKSIKNPFFEFQQNLEIKPIDSNRPSQFLQLKSLDIECHSPNQQKRESQLKIIKLSNESESSILKYVNQYNNTHNNNQNNNNNINNNNNNNNNFSHSGSREFQIKQNPISQKFKNQITLQEFLD